MNRVNNYTSYTHKILDELCTNLNRYEIISRELNKFNVSWDYFNFHETSNIVCSFCTPESLKNVNESIKVISAHYDVMPNTPGANDNGAGVALMLSLVKQLKDMNYNKNVVIIFFDKEEKLGLETTDKEFKSRTGSYFFGKWFNETHNRDRYKFYAFDVCGIGDTMVISKGLQKYRGAYNDRYNHIIDRVDSERDLFSHFCAEHDVKHVNTMTPNGDDLPLMFSSIPALNISILPEQEARDLHFNAVFPTTWKRNHTEHDNFEKIEFQTLNMMNNFLFKLCEKEYLL